MGNREQVAMTFFRREVLYIILAQILFEEMATDHA